MKMITFNPNLTYWITTQYYESQLIIIAKKKNSYFQLVLANKLFR